MINQYFTSLKEIQKGIYFYKLNRETGTISASSTSISSLTWPPNLTKDVIRVNECVPARLGEVIKYDWPKNALPILKEYFKELTDEILSE